MIYISHSKKWGMNKHMRIIDYDSYMVGVGIEHPGIIVSAESETELINEFRISYDSYMRAIKRFHIEEKPERVVIINF